MDNLNYKPGDRVLIADELGELKNQEGKMDKYCGTVMTIKSVLYDGYAYQMEEDGGRWVWAPKMVAGPAEEFEARDEAPAPVVREISFEEIMLGKK